MSAAWVTSARIFISKPLESNFRDMIHVKYFHCRKHTGLHVIFSCSAEEDGSSVEY